MQLVKGHAILEEPDQRVGLDIGREGQRFGVAEPASRELQGGIAKARLLQVAPDWGQRLEMRIAQWGRGTGNGPT